MVEAQRFGEPASWPDGPFLPPEGATRSVLQCELQALTVTVVLRELRRDSGAKRLTQAKLAAAAGFSTGKMSRWVNGEIWLKEADLLAVVEALGLVMAPVPLSKVGVSPRPPRLVKKGEERLIGPVKSP